jgi:tripartite-type tricarboxylate transporter receptor subunit TctC
MKALRTCGLATVGLAAVLTMTSLLSPALAQSPAEFYKDKVVTLYVGSDAGAGYDAYARILSRYLGKYIPGNPSIIVRNMPGAGSLRMANYLVSGGPKDGTAIGAPQSSVAVERLLHLLSKDDKAANFDATKLNWIGSTTQDTFVFLGSPEAKAKTLKDMTENDFVLGASGPNTDGSIVVAAMNTFLGTRIKLVTGYAGTAAQLLAMERKEIDGAVMAYSTLTTLRPNVNSEGKINILMQVGESPHPDLKGVPLLKEILKSQDERDLCTLLFAKYKMGRPYFLTPEVPADRVAAIRAAFDKTVRDPDFLVEAKQQRLEVDPVNGAEVQALVAQMYAAPDALVQRARALMTHP